MTAAPKGTDPDLDPGPASAATAWPLSQWSHRLPELLCDASRRDDLHTYLGRLATGPTTEAPTGAEAEHLGLADEVFDWLVRVHDTTDWTGTKTPTGFRAPASVHMVTESLKTVGRAITPARAARHVAERIESGVAFYPGMIEVLAGVTDPAVLAAACGYRPSSHTRSDLGYPWRAMCLRNPHLPSACADEILLEAAVQPGQGRSDDNSVTAAGLIDYAHAAAVLADPQVAARVVLADPERWWFEIVRSGVTRSNPRGTGFHVRARDIHAAMAGQLAEVIVDMRTQYAPGERVSVSGVQLVSRAPLRERLWWLLKCAEGPGFDTVVETLLTHPDKTVRRKAAAHPQLPLRLVADLLTHPDEAMRRGAEQVLSRALGEV